MRRLASGCLSVVFTLPLAAAGGDKEDLGPIRTQIVEQVNRFRQEQGLKALAVNAKLTAAAQKHAAALAALDKAGDDDKNPHILNGKKAPDRITAEGYRWAGYSENIGMTLGHPDPAAAAVRGWEKSAIHRKNMLTPERTETGVGVGKSKAGKVWIVQVYCTPAR